MVASIVPIVAGKLLQLPPVTGSLNVTHVPTHSDDGPRIAVGDGLTHTVVVFWQPVGKVYIIGVQPNVVPPVRRPDTGSIVAMAGNVLVQPPPVVASLSVIVLPMHTAVGPVIGAGNGLTVITPVIKHPVPRV